MAAPGDPAATDLPAEAAELFAAQPDEFVELRDALAKNLKSQGSTEQAKAVKRLRKPTLAVWATNQAARRRPELVKQLLAAGRTMASSRSSAELRKASTDRQAAVRALLNEAADRLEESGHQSAGTIDKITQTLLAVSSDDAAAEVFAKGMLEQELEPELDFGFSLPGAGEELGEGDSQALRDARSKAGELETRARELEAEVAELEHDDRSARDRLELARMEVERMARRLESARSRLAKARQQADDARSTLEELEG